MWALPRRPAAHALARRERRYGAPAKAKGLRSAVRGQLEEVNRRRGESARPGATSQVWARGKRRQGKIEPEMGGSADSRLFFTLSAACPLVDHLHDLTKDLIVTPHPFPKALRFTASPVLPFGLCRMRPFSP
jgi:hypothetical protein